MTKPLKSFEKLITATRRYTETGEPIPELIQERFRFLHNMTTRSVSQYMDNANSLHLKMSQSKTKHKANLYERKFNKVRSKFQAEVKRLTAIESIMTENDISVDASK